MKFSLYFKVMFLSLVVLLSTGAFAANDSHKGGVNLSAPVQAAGKQLPAGDYTVKWDGTGPDAQVTFVRDGKVMATVPARVVKLDRKPSQDTIEVKTASNGDRSLIAIRFEGKAYGLELGGESAGGDTTTGSNVK